MGVMHCPKHGPQGLSTAFVLGITKRAHCPECLHEEKYYAAKNAGRPLPFVGYEHTLNWGRVPDIENLEEFLRKRYSFQKSRCPYSGGCDSLVVLPGSFTEPLTIYIYYVTDDREQDNLLAIIEDFFLKSDYPQRRVRFFKEERWYETVTPTGSSYGQLEAVLVREETMM